MNRLDYEHLLGASQLGVLHVLETTLAVAILTLAAAHPEIQDHPGDDNPEALTALEIVEAARAFIPILRRYARALTRRDDHDLPF